MQNRCKTIGRNRAKRWSGRRESNPRHTAWEAVVLPLNYARARRSAPAPQDNAKGGRGKAGTASALALRRACFTLGTISGRVVGRICVLAPLTEMPPIRICMRESQAFAREETTR